MEAVNAAKGVIQGGDSEHVLMFSPYTPKMLESVL